jgi:uncharacterized 2Fe-2S/4Fe-4S cluster protein (DUF4445 family)
MPSPTSFEIDFEPVGKRVEVPPDTPLLDAARSAGIELASACGGEGHCGQCRVTVISGDVSPPIDAEKFILTELELRQGDRLACCAHALSDVKVNVPTRSLITNQRLQLTSEGGAGPVDPLIRDYSIAVPRPTLEDLRADAERIIDALREVHGLSGLTLSPPVISQLSTQARDYGWQMSVYVRDGVVVGIAPVDAAPVGMAVDLGTTKLAAYLVDLRTGEELAVTGRPNPQIGYGEDVISRLVFTKRSEGGGQVMSDLIRSALDEMLGALVEQAGVSRAQVADICIVGNTAMTHLLLGLPVGQLASAPYVAATNAPVDVLARDLELAAAPGAAVHILPCIGGFVGADHVAMILASDLDQTDKVTLGIDIGTNTEIALARPGEPFMSSVSCASGPAFEGAHISDGMRAAAGAIEAVHLTGESVELKTIDDAPAVGLCGSGIVDAIAELHRWGVINPRGRFDRESDRVRTGRRGPEILLVPGDRSGSERDIAVTQEDVNEIQLAKGAIRAGLDVLLDVTGTAPEDVEEVLIAGAFGSFLDIQSALDMGLLPRYPNAVYKQVGNAAVLGAWQALISRHQRDRAHRIAENTHYIELTTHPSFRRAFALGMLFPEHVSKLNITDSQDGKEQHT